MTGPNGGRRVGTEGIAIPTTEKKRVGSQANGGPDLEELEPRILLSAGVESALLAGWGLDADLLLPDTSAGHAALLSDNTVAAGIHSVRNELVFIDSATPDWQQLTDALRAETGPDVQLHTVLIEAGRDGIEQISQVLMGYSNLDAVHIVAHGADGSILVGDGVIDGENLAANAMQIEGWGDALSADADLLIYGCNLASGADGRALIGDLARLTGADVAASDDVTGHDTLGGDWALEHQVGNLETGVVISEKTQATWLGSLAPQSLLWLSSNGNATVLPGHGIGSWTDGELIEFGDPNLAVEPGITDGTFSSYFDIDVFAGANTSLSGLHFVASDITVGSANAIALTRGDLLLSIDSTETLGGVTVTKSDVVLFRPDTVGDYSTGTFTMLLQNPLGAELNAFALVETATTVGDAALDAGDFLLVDRGLATDIVLWQTADVGAGTTSGSSSVLIAGSDINLSQNIVALELVQTSTDIGAVTLTPGQLLLTLETDDSTVGDNNIAVKNYDVFILDVTMTGVGTSAATASLLFEGADVGIDSGGEEFEALALRPASAWSTTSFQQGVDGYVDSVDTYIDQGNPTTGFGTATSLSIDLEATDGNANTQHQGLIRFDNLIGSGPGQIPLGATIVSATLTFDSFDPAPGSTISLHRMLQAWGSGDSWNTLVNGLQRDDVEAMTGPDSSVVSPTTGPVDFTDLADAVQAWADGASNYGWAIFGSANEGWNASSSETATPALRPRLEITWAPPVWTVSGNIFEDIDGDALLGDAVGVGGVVIDLYIDDGDGVIDAGDSYQSSAVTDGSGYYELAVTADGTYWVVVDSTTVTPLAGLNGGFGTGDVWAEQTYGTAGAATFDGSYNFLGGAGSLYGGMQAEVSDDASALTSAEHVTRVIIAGADVAGVDSAFSFNAITRTGDGDDDPGANRSVQGSLRQFIQNSNAIVGTQSSQFAIASTDSNYNATGNGEYTIAVGAGGLPMMTDAVILDATTQSGYAGDPIVELDGAAATGASAGLNLRTDNSTVRGFIVHSFPDEGIEMDGSTGFGDNNTIQNNWVGLDATGAAAGNADNGVLITAGAAGNLIGGTGANDGNVIVGSTTAGILIRMVGSDNNVVEGNYVGLAADGVTPIANMGYGIDIHDGASGNRIGGATVAARNVISGNAGYGIIIWDATTTLNVVQGNYIGTDHTGTIAVGNTADGIDIGGGATNNVIGGSAAGEGNLISGNLNDGIEILGAGTAGNTVLGNRIGTNAAGTAALGNARHGVVIYDGANTTTVGGAAAGAGNLISANGADGIVIDGNFGATTTANSIQGNYIGTNLAGNAALGNGANGIHIFQNAGNNLIGGLAAGQGNLISANTNAGIRVDSSNSIDIYANLIGTAADGTTPLGNGTDGVHIFNSDFVTIGSPTGGNVIAASGDSGIELGDSILAMVQGNFIGTDAGATLDLGNTGSGIVLFGVTGSAMIGGTVADEGNAIAHSGNNGVYLAETVATGNSILGNSIHSNAQLGIELVETGPVWGVTPNDSGDIDSGPNGLQNFPLMISANTDAAGNVYLSGTLHSAATTSYRIEFFANSTQEASGHGEGATYLGYIDVVTDGTGRADFATTVLATVSVDDFVTTTATAADGSTSEFSRDVVSLNMQTLVVDTSGDAADGDTASITALLANRGADNRISLREAILATNATANTGVPDRIHFNLQLDDANHFYYRDDGLAGSLSLVASTNIEDSAIADFDPDYAGAGYSWFKIQPTAALPTITEAVVVDGYTQQGATPNTLGIGTDAILKIEINGDVLSGGNGLTITASSTELRGLIVNGAFSIGIVFNGSLASTLAGSYIGTDASGMQSGGGLSHGIYLNSGASNINIGGADPGSRNVVSGLIANGISLLNPTTLNNQIRGNYIGTNAAGTSAVANGFNGVILTDGTSGNTLQNNVISSNNIGIVLDGTSSPTDANVIVGNLVGTDATGTVALANVAGILMQRGVTNTTIGGTTAASRNVISGNIGSGIRLVDAATTGNSVLGNYIGTDASGSTALANGQSGIQITSGATGNIVGGTMAGAGNVISGNSGNAISLESGASGNQVHGNFIGVDAGGSGALANGQAGIRISGAAANNEIGGTTAAAGNVIAFNSGAGIELALDAGIGNSLLGNSIHSNTGLGIDLLPVGATANDSGDGDAGPNDLQNYPLLTGAWTDGAGTITIDGSLNSLPSGTYRVEFFASASGDASGHGEAEVYLGFLDVVTDGSGNVSFSAPLAAVVPVGYTITATATAAGGSTSEFAANVLAVSLPPVIDLDANDSSGAGGADYTTGFVENGGPVAITDTDASLTDDSPVLQWLTVTITNLLDGVLELLAADTSGTSIFASYDAGTGVLTLSGADTVARYEQVLRTVVYDNASEDPNTTARNIEFVASDGSSSSNVATATVSVARVNDAPVMTAAAPSLPTITEDDVGNSGVSIATLIGGSVSDADSGAVEGIAITGLVSGNGTWEFSTDGGATWTAVGAVADSSALLLRDTDRVRFVPDGRNADSASFDYSAWDQTTGSAGSYTDVSTNGGTTAFSSATDTASITVTDVNDAPVLTIAGPVLPSINEDDIGDSGVVISTLLVTTVGDLDNGAVEGIAITGLASGNGTWEYSTDGGTTWTAVGAVSDSSALLLRDTDRVRFVPDGQNADTASFTFRAWDQTAGTFGTYTDVTVNGGTTAYSSASDTASITVSAVNDAPVLTVAAPSLPVITEDDTSNSGVTIATVLGGSVSDVDTGAVEGVAITGLASGNGSWEYSTDAGATWTAVGAVSDSSALLLRDTDRVRFVPDGQNADTASFTFRAWDQTAGSAGTYIDVSTNGGTTAFSTASDTASITVSAVNDAPVLTAASPTLPTITEDDTGNVGVTVAALLSTSVDDVDTGALEGIAITGLLSGNGSWDYSTNGGATWTTVGAVSDSAALLLRDTDRVRFVPDGQNADTASFTFRAWDQTAGTFGTYTDVTVNGGTTAYSSASDTASITVSAVNDAPVLTVAAPSLPVITEDDTSNSGVTIATVLGGSVSDVDTGAVEGVAITGLASGNGNWEYSTDAGASWTAVGAVSDSAALLLRDTDRVRFVPDGQNADTASFTFRAWDQTSGTAGTYTDVTVNGGATAYSSASDTASITVSAVNDAPVIDVNGVMTLTDVVEDDTNPPGDTVAAIVASAGGDRITDVDTGAVEGIAVIAVDDTNGTWQYSTDGGASWLAFGTVSDASAVLLDASAAIRFVPDADYIGTAGNIAFRAWDQSSGSVGQTGVDVSTNGGTTAFSVLIENATLAVIAQNDAPVLTPAAPVLPAISEDNLGDSGVSIATLLGGSVTDVDSGAVEGIAITGLASGNGSWEYSTDGGATWTAVGAVSDSSALLLRDTDRVRFVPDGQNADTASFTFRAWDQTAGSAGTYIDVSTNGGTTAFSTASDTASITVSAVNDAPVLTAASPTLPTITEDDTGNVGVTVAALLSTSVDDVDTGALEGIAITGLLSGNGSWEYSTNGGATWTTVGAVSDSAALLLRDTDRVRFVPDGQNADTASFTFRAWDQTAGTFGTYTDVTVNGGTTAYSSASDTASITVSAVNDAPVLTVAAPSLPTITEDDSANSGVTIATVLGGSVSDVDTGALEGIAITALVSGNGSWEYSTDAGATWTAVGAVSDSSALLLRDTDRVRFVPDVQNADTASFTFRAWDQTAGSAGTYIDVSTNGGTTAFSTANDTASITVSAVNDAPALTVSAPSLPTITEDDIANGGVTVASLLAGSVTDVDSGAVEGIAITSLASGNGSWEFSTDGGATWTAVGAVSDASALLLRDTDQVRFVPDGENADTASFTFRAWDQTTGSAGAYTDVSTNGGTTAFSSATDTASITVTDVNDAPVLTIAGPVLPGINEDDIGNGGVTVASLLAGSVADVDSGAVEGIAITGLVSGNGSWDYSTDGGATWAAVGAVSDTSALLLRDTDRVRFVPDGQNADSAGFDFRAWDRTAGSAGSYTDLSINGGTTAFSAASDSASITVSAVNDAPVLDGSGDMTLTDIVEDATNPPGNTVAAIISSAGGDRITDIDFGAVEGIAVIGVDDANGTWQYSTDGGSSWLAFGAVADTAAVLLEDGALIRFVPATSYTGPAGDLVFRAWDQSSGFDGQTGVDVSSNGGSTAFSTATETATLAVIARNDAPVLTPAAPTLPSITEDDLTNGGVLIATLLGTSVTDVDAGAVEGIAITGLVPGNGNWEYSSDGGATWTAVGAVSDSSALLLRDTDRVRFVPDGQNADMASFDFRAWDQTTGSAGTYVDASANGGTTAFSSATDSASISVSGVNDAPTTTGLPDVATDEDAAPMLIDLSSFFSDVDATDTLSFDVVGVSNAALLADASVDATGVLRLELTPDAFGQTLVTVRATDSAGAFVETQFVVDVNAVNDAPTTVGFAPLLVNEDSAISAIDLTTIFSDIDDTALTYSIVANDNPALSQAAIDITGGTLAIELADDAFGSGTLMLRATDAAGATADAALSLTVAAVDDPTLISAPATQSLSQTDFVLFSDASGNAIRVDDVDGGDVTVTLAVPGGTLSLGTVEGLTFAEGSGAGDTRMTFSGSIAAVNAALDGLRYRPASGFDGVAELQISSWSPGSPPQNVTTDTIQVLVLQALAPPELAAAGAPVQPSDNATASSTVADDDADQPPAENRVTSASQPDSPLPGTVLFAPIEPAEVSGAVEAVEVARPDRGGLGSAKYLGALQRLLDTVGSQTQLPVIVITDAVWDALDAMADQISGDDIAGARHDLLVTVASGLTLSLSAGFVTWMMRAGSLVGSLLSMTPLWRGFDPLPVIAARRDGEDDDEESDDVAELFGGGR